MQKVKTKHILLSTLVLMLLFGVYHRKMVIYLSQQASGQLKIISNTISIEEALQSDTISDKSRYLLELIPEIKTFAELELGLTPKSNYTNFYNQNGEPILWALTACPAYTLEPYKWNFPILGELEYKGFFEKSIGKKEESRLKQLGYDTELSEVSAWSTLGILSDPILSSMLELDTGRFVRLLIHELTHATVYIADDAMYNENLATYVGDNGALAFLIKKYGASSRTVNHYKNELQDIEQFSEFTNAFSKSLEQFYNTLPAHSSFWPMMKSRMIQSYKNNLVLLPFNNKKKYRKINDYELNNAYFTGFLMYHNQQDSIARLVKNEYSGSIKKMIEALK